MDTVEQTIREYAQLGIELDRTMAQAVLAAEAHEEHRWDHLALLAELAEQADEEEG